MEYVSVTHRPIDIVRGVHQHTAGISDVTQLCAVSITNLPPINRASWCTHVLRHCAQLLAG